MQQIKHDATQSNDVDLGSVNSLETVEVSNFMPNGHPVRRNKRIDLSSIDSVRVNMASVFRDARSGKIDTQDGARLIYMLSQIGKMLELGQLEKRLEALEKINAKN